MNAAIRNYLVIIDATPESRVALRFAARRAVKTDGHLTLLHIIPPADFIQWGGVQHMMEAEAQEKAETLLTEVAEQVMAETGLRPSIDVRMGKPADEVLMALGGDTAIHALVLGAAAKGAPGPLVAFFAGETAGQLPCPIVIVPGGLTDEAIERLA